MNALVVIAAMFAVTICSGIAADQNRQLHIGDYITITFTNKHDQLDGIYSVATDGFTIMPFIGKIKTEGVSLSDLKTTLEREYDRQEIYKALQVSVERMDKPPDMTPYRRDLNVLDARIKEMEANPFWDKKGDFFIPKNQKSSLSESTNHATNK